MAIREKMSYNVQMQVYSHRTARWIVNYSLIYISTHEEFDNESSCDEYYTQLP